MFFVLAGEGGSDLGTVLSDGTMRKGVMAFLIDAISEKFCGVKPEYCLVTESRLKSLKKEDRRNIMGECKERKPFEELYLSAVYLGRLAMKCSSDEERAGVVFFKDSDGTNTAPIHLWESIVRAIQAGFEDSENPYGVPMVPRPKSEAWLMGYYQKSLPRQQAYNHCERFENMPGNDNSPNSLKTLLKMALNTDGDVYDLIGEDEIFAIQWERIDMPSLNLFRKRLENVLAAMTSSPYPHPVNETWLT